MQYELFYLIGELKEPELPQIKEAVKKIVESEGARFFEPEIIEKRKMAYKIKGQFRGIYVARRFELPEKEEEEKNEIQSISKKIKLNPDILRFIILNARELPELKPHKMIARDKFSRISAGREERPRYAKKPADKISKKEAPAEKPAIPKKEAKSIDEKLEEILNI